MKTITKRSFFILFSIVSATGIILAAIAFVTNVKSLLWEKSVTDIIEVTQQGSHALDTYIEKDYDTLHLFVRELQKTSAADKNSIQEIVSVFNEDGTSFYCSDLSSGITYSNLPEKIPRMTKEQRKMYAKMSGSSIRDPFLDGYTGVKTIGVFERFTFRDGTQGIAQKTRPLTSMTERFSLSFFNQTGFSYVVNQNGDVLIRSLHKDSNRTFQNLFDIIDLQGNDEEQLNFFKQRLKESKTGAAQFRYQGEEYIFCYVPLYNGDNWNIVSIIPNRIIMQQANSIIKQTIALCLFIMLVLAAFGYLYHRNRKKHQKEIEKLAFYDNLTGLYRYEKFLLDGQLILEKKEQPVAVLYLDIMGFKLLNDMEGYGYGDRVLLFVADILRSVAKQQDICCRISGDDFILLTPYAKKEEITETCRQILTLSTTGVDNRHDIPIRIGICLQEDADIDSTISTLVDRARMAQTGIHDDSTAAWQFYNEEMREILLRDAEMEQHMEQALRDGEFLHVIQPKYALDGSQILGGEALLRWQRKGHGFTNPGEFIPLFERNGFIRKLDTYVFISVCQTIQKRLAQGKAVVPISVNVSRIHLYQEDFADSYIAIKNQYHIPDGIIELELTENILLKNTREIFTILEKLRSHGFCCSIDDFGSGYSSLNALKDLPVDVVKLDRVFFDQSSHVERNKTILKSMISMAKELDMKVVAEGIECTQQLDMLQDTGCDMVQGFIYAKPCSEEDFYHRVETE